MKLWPTLGVAFLLITSMRLSWSLGRENARNEAQASTLKSTVDTLNIISAGVQDMQQVLAQLRAENQQRNQDGEVRCNFAFFSGLISAQFWAGRAQPKSPELGANLLVMFPVFHSQQQTTGERIIAA